MNISSEERAARIDLAAAHRWADLNGWSGLIFNHFTARVPGEPDSFLIKPHTLLFSEVTASNLVKVPLHGRAEEHPSANRAGYIIHAAILRARPDINSVMHVHSPVGMALCASKRGLRCLNQEAMKFYNRVGYHDFEGIALEAGERERLTQNLGAHKVLILRNHGILTCGNTIPEAAVQLHDLIAAADAQLRIEASGAEICEPAPDICETAARQFEGIFKQTGYLPEWNAVVRMLDRHDTSYRA